MRLVAAAGADGCQMQTIFRLVRVLTGPRKAGEASDD